HVASQPEVTDEEHPVDGVPMGSKKVREQLKIVRDETDDYEPGHVLLTKLLVDAQADIAVLKARKLLPVMPYRIGRSGALRAGNLVQVRGFPLGAFAALNTGKVLNPLTQDTERGWNHVDFMIDALLASGNSGSPVFAISCRSSEPELVGIDDDYPLSTRETMALVDRGANGFGTLDSVVVPVDGQSTEAPVQALEGDVREHFDKLYESLWRQVLGVADYRSRLAKGRLSADA